MKFLRSFLGFFVSITTAVLVMCAVAFELYGISEIPKDTLWNVLLSGAATGFVTALFFHDDSDSGWRYIVKSVIHYICICGVMFFFGVRFGWIDFTIRGAVMMAFDCAIVYIAVLVISYILNKREADELNKALRNKYDKNGD